MEEEAKMTPPLKTKKEGKDVTRTSRVFPKEKTPSPVSKSKGGTEASVGLPLKKPAPAPQDIKGKEKVPNPSEKPPK